MTEQQMFEQALALSHQWDRMARVPLGDPVGFHMESAKFWEMHRELEESTRGAALPNKRAAGQSL